MKLKLLFIGCCIITFFTACKKDKIKDNNTAFFGGEIINPNSKKVYLLKSNKVIDTFVLDKKNRFKYEFSDLKPGLYDFRFGNEYQTFLLQPNDSIMFRLNTIEFDESLVYSGKGSKENNFLINLYLENEKEEKLIFKLSQLKPKAFELKLNELRENKLKRLEAFKVKYNPSNLFIEIAEANINYKYYSNKEFYPFVNFSKSKLETFNSLPDNFYEYRNDIHYNNENLEYYRPYTTFLRFHINNLALHEHFKHSNDSEYDELSLDINLDKLKLIDEKISNEHIKNRLLYYNMIRFINNSKETDDYDELLESFKIKSTNNKHINRAQHLVDSYKRLKPGNKIPEIVLLDANDKPINLSSIVKKPTVIYFWTKYDKNHVITSHKRIKELNVKYPEVEFIAINTDSMSYSAQKNILNRYRVRIHNEYRLQSPTKALELLSVKPINNVYILDKKDRIVNAKANIFTIHFEQELLGVINQ